MSDNFKIYGRKDCQYRVMVPINKWNRDPNYKEVVELTLKDCDNHRALGHPLSGLMISGYAEMNADMIMKDTSGRYSKEVQDKYLNAAFGATFIHTFLSRYDYRRLKVNGERATVDEKEVDRKMDLIRNNIIHYVVGPADIWNWDETGLFYRSTPTGTLARKGDHGAGNKVDKLRITLLLCVNGDGSKKEMVLIGKSAKPRGTSPEYWQSKGIKYYSNKSAWMTSEIFLELIQDFDRKLTRPADLLLDNFSGHIKDFEGLHYINLKGLTFTYLEVIFLPPNFNPTVRCGDNCIFQDSL